MASLTEQRDRIARALYAAVLSDVMDSLGLATQAMRPFVRPLDEELVLFGRARTGLYMPVYSVRAGENPYDVEIALVRASGEAPRVPGAYSGRAGKGLADPGSLIAAIRLAAEIARSRQR